MRPPQLRVFVLVLDSPICEDEDDPGKRSRRPFLEKVGGGGGGASWSYRLVAREIMVVI